MLILAQVFPLSEKSASMKWGSRNTDTIPLMESDDEFQTEETLTVTKSMAVSSQPLNYSFYKSFWSLQQDFASSAIQDLSSFISRLKALLDMLETRKPNEAGAAISTQDANESLPLLTLASKYLVSSRLLPIQLVDPQFRICVLSQFLIVAHNLALEAPSVGAQLALLQQRAKNLLPLDYGNMLNTILNTSELQWRQWKKDKCPDLETNVEAIMAVAQSMSRKRRLDDANGSTSSSKKSAYTHIDLREDLHSICRNMKQLVPSVDDHLEEYVEALDPDSGIEAEYHPKSSAFFNWQALRLMSYQNLGDFDRLYPNGDYEAMVRHVWQRDKNVIIPGTAPEYPDEDVEEVEEDEPLPMPVEVDKSDDREIVDEDMEDANLTKDDAPDGASPSENGATERNGAEMEFAIDDNAANDEIVDIVEEENNMETTTEEVVIVESKVDQATGLNRDVSFPQDKSPAPDDTLRKSDGRLEREPERSNNNRGRGRADVLNQDNKRGGSVDSGSNRRHEDDDRGPFGGGRRDDSRRPLERRWEPAGRRDDQGGPRREDRTGPRRDDRTSGPSGGPGRGSNRRRR
jgi:THO complex subunit 1